MYVSARNETPTPHACLFSVFCVQMLSKFEIGTLVTREFVPYKSDESGFYRDMCLRVGKVRCATPFAWCASRAAACLECWCGRRRGRAFSLVAFRSRYSARVRPPKRVL